jgi:hypothetical protein
MLSGSGTGVVHVQRYWLPAGTMPSLTADGWLDDPTSGLFHIPNADAMTTAELVDSRCLVLLGEPGIGKTSALAAHGQLAPPGSEIAGLSVDLGSFSSEDRLARRVFENDTITAWAAGQGTLCLTLDGFDEAHQRIENLHVIARGVPRRMGLSTSPAPHRLPHGCLAVLASRGS